MNTVVKIALLVIALLYYLGSIGAKEDKAARLYVIAGSVTTALLLVALKFL